MTTRIAYSDTGIGQQISNFVNDVENVLAKGRRLKAKLDSMSFGNDWGAVEAETGATAGQGQNLWTLISTAMQQIDSPQIAELARLDKQG